MNEKKSDNFLKAGIAILALCLLGLGYFTFRSYTESKTYVEGLEQEKAALKSELEELLANYEEAVINNKLLKKNFSEAEQKIGRLLDSMEKMEATYVFMRKYKKQVNTLKKEKESLFSTIDSLAKLNKSLRDNLDSTRTDLAQTTKRKDSLLDKNKKLSEKVSEAFPLKVIKLKAHAVAIGNKGETEIVDRAGRGEKIEVCFTLAKNKLIPRGEKRLFVQVINPKNDLLGKKATIVFGQAVLNYSKIVDVFYEKEQQNVCTMIKTESDDVVKGRYIVNVFMGSERLGNVVFELE